MSETIPERLRRVGTAMGDAAGPFDLLMEAADDIDHLSAEVERPRGERDAAVMEVSRQAAARGRAEGALEASEAAGVVEGWRARAEAAEARVAVLITERAQLSKALKWANERVGSLSVPAMEGDNLAIVLCSFFDDGEPPEDETGWGPSAVEGYEQTIRAIGDHYNTALAALSHTKEVGND